jgi:hypothetical protein
MIVHLLTEQEKDSLIGKYYFSNTLFNPIQDNNNNWIISQEEVLNAVYEDVLWVKNLPTIEYIAKPPIINSN